MLSINDVSLNVASYNYVIADHFLDAASQMLASATPWCESNRRPVGCVALLRPLWIALSTAFDNSDEHDIIRIEPDVRCFSHVQPCRRRKSNHFKNCPAIASFSKLRAIVPNGVRHTRIDNPALVKRSWGYSSIGFSPTGGPLDPSGSCPCARIFPDLSTGGRAGRLAKEGIEHDEHTRK